MDRGISPRSHGVSDKSRKELPITSVEYSEQFMKKNMQNIVVRNNRYYIEEKSKSKINDSFSQSNRGKQSNSNIILNSSSMKTIESSKPRSNKSSFVDNHKFSPNKDNENYSILVK